MGRRHAHVDDGHVGAVLLDGLPQGFPAAAPSSASVGCAAWDGAQLAMANRRAEQADRQTGDGDRPGPVGGQGV
jgi:hypothetical protein